MPVSQAEKIKAKISIKKSVNKSIQCKKRKILGAKRLMIHPVPLIGSVKFNTTNIDKKK